MKEELVKGVILIPAWAHIHSMLERGRISRDALETMLGPRDLEILDDKIEPTLWYPLETAVRFGEVRQKVTGEKGGPEDLVTRGREIAKSILANPNIQRFFESARMRGEQAGPVLVKMSSLLFNFAEMHHDGGYAVFAITMTNADRIPDPIRYTIQGVIQEIAELAIGSPVEVTSTRTAEGTIVYRGDGT